MNDDATREDGGAPASPETADSARVMVTQEDLIQRRVNRRRLMVASAASGVAATALAVPRLRAQEATPASGPTTPEEAAEQVATVVPGSASAMVDTGHVAGGFQFFVPFQAAIVQAVAARLIPSDDTGPGATEAGVVYFIDRELYEERTGYIGYRGQRYATGPFAAGEATQGDQSALPMAERFRIGILGLEGLAQERYGNGFVSLSADQQDELLRAMDAGEIETFGRVSLTTQPAVFQGGDQGVGASTGQSAISAKAFFELLLAYTIAGFFSDPVHGGNRDMNGWKLIGFPGAQMGYADWILRYGEPFNGPYLSLADHQTAMAGGA
ncbi:MAG: gluconate 2-dehydrogenase subunit 3 family protein [Thermomicrobiales bacterium]